MTRTLTAGTWSHMRRRVVLSLALVAHAACGGGETSDTPSTTEDSPAGANDLTAVVELGAERYTFDRVFCDLEDGNDDDMLARASGTAPDGRSATMEVERREVMDQYGDDDRLHDRITVYFGSRSEEDQWHAVANGPPGGEWSSGVLVGEPRDGPLIVIDGNELTAEGSFTHEIRDETLEGSVRIVCGD